MQHDVDVSRDSMLELFNCHNDTNRYWFIQGMAHNQNSDAPVGMHVSKIEFPIVLQGAAKSLIVDAQMFERKKLHSNIVVQEGI